MVNVIDRRMVDSIMVRVANDMTSKRLGRFIRKHNPAWIPCRAREIQKLTLVYACFNATQWSFDQQTRDAHIIAICDWYNSIELVRSE